MNNEPFEKIRKVLLLKMIRGLKH